ncbi:MAG: DUF4198 domain-containing protein [Burkholderiales bacterium]|nr:DUF4198 domain-containing protein [Burkholderiales bacterium]
MRPISVLGLAILTCVTTARAHDAWVEPEGPRYAVSYGHSDRSDPYEAKKIKKLVAYDAAGKVLQTTLVADGERLAAEPATKPAMLVLDFDNGFWCKVDGKSRNQPKTEIPGATDGSRSWKFGKTIVLWSGAASRPTGQKLELVPVADAAPRDGEALVVTVLYEGKPLAGAKVTLGGHDDDKPVVTGDDGKASVVVHRGRQMIGVSHSVPWDGPEADKLNMAANLLFVVR